MGIDLTQIEEDWRKISTQFDSKCCICGERIKEGTDVLWKKGKGIRHIEECYDVEEVTPTDDLIIIEEDIVWLDPEKHSHDKLEEITVCQRCGQTLDKTKDTFINLDRRTCERCFLK